MKIQAAILTQINTPLEIWELQAPKLKKGQVLVQMAYSGLCHSQVNEIRGLKGEDKFIPHTLGHEGSGIVLEIGDGVTKVEYGDSVVVSWLKGKGIDASGTQYLSDKKTVNSGPVSTFLTHAVISENRLVKLDQRMPLKEAALLGCAIPTGAGVVQHEMGLKPGESFAIYGAGGVGLSALVAAKLAQAFPIIVVDIEDSKLEKARNLGATHLVNAKKTDPVAAIFEWTQGKGVDFVFESAGKKEAMEKAFSSLKAPGLCVVAGNLPKGERISLDPFDLIRGKKIIGTWGGKSDIDRDVAYYTSQYLEGHLPLSALITHEVTLLEINDLIHELEHGRVTRGMVRFI